MANLLKIKHISNDWHNSNDQSVSVGIYENLQLNRQLQGVNRKLGRAISHTLSAGLIKGKVEGTSVCYCIDGDNWKIYKNEINMFFSIPAACDDSRCC